MWGPGIICICPPIGGRIPGPARKQKIARIAANFLPNHTLTDSFIRYIFILSIISFKWLVGGIYSVQTC